jgi:membrane protein
MRQLREAGRLTWRTLEGFLRDGCPAMAASVSFYTLFSLPPLVILLLFAAEPFLEAGVAVEALRVQVGSVLGPAGGDQVAEVLEHATRPGGGGLVAGGIGILAFLFGATAAFAQLQSALNTIWHVGPNPGRGEVGNFLLKRVLSFAMIAVIGFLLLISLVVSAVLAAAGERIMAAFPGAVAGAVLEVVYALFSFAVVTLLFTAMLAYLPDAVIGARDALVGALVTAALFTLGRTAIGAYLGGTDPGDGFGAAGSLAMVLIWVYYSAMTVFLGAVFTREWTAWRGRPILPDPGAVHIERHEEQAPGPVNAP